MESVEIIDLQVVRHFGCLADSEVNTMLLDGTGKSFRALSSTSRIGKFPHPGHQAISFLAVIFKPPSRQVLSEGLGEFSYREALAVVLQNLTIHGEPQFSLQE